MKKSGITYIAAASVTLLLAGCDSTNDTTVDNCRTKKCHTTSCETTGCSTSGCNAASCQTSNCVTTNPTTDNNKLTTKNESTSQMTPVKTASGLEYTIITEGSGATPTHGKQVTVHYTGWLQNADGTPGKKFDSSVDRGEPFTFGIGMGYVIKGWDEGVATMKIGEKRRLIIPATLGYGARGAGGAIPPNATLIFDVELLSIA